MNPTIKAGYKTTEFWITVLTAFVGLGVATGFIDPASAHGAGVVGGISVAAGLLAMAVPAAGYALSRAMVKAPVVPAVVAASANPIWTVAPSPPASLPQPAHASVAPGPAA